MVPNKAFDSEYMTQWRREVEFLADKGIRYVYVKRVGEYNISTFKYTKTPELFLALTEFYTQVRNERTFKNIETLTKQMENGYIPVKKEDLTEPEKELMEILDDTE